MYNPRSSPIKVKVVPPVRGPAGGKIVKPLVFGTPIKVYNAIGRKFKFDSSTFDNLDELFPLWEDELPYRSYTIVCHTCQVYKSPTNGTVLNYYIQWILLLGLPL
ncbi:hypothetical protein BDN70DRAFT_902306 [Pholiota conissans]|uniref:Uncharacterized protein n=1 Tax=Pholiota conissans TaxID=109636 RepID=A0A9P6CQG8_9AGAR|nr:hypothetical protein BDN70DRAFT_902306 [Pholiota conissans]